jgi:hypothetical protein
MADGGGNSGGGDGQLVKIVALGAAAFAGYKLVYLPWAQQRKLQEEIEAQTRANLAKGMGIEEAGQKAISAACQAVAAFYKIPPDKSGGVCAGVGILAEKSIKATIKGAIIAGKVVGKGAAVVGRTVGKGAVAVAKATKTVAVGTAKAVKFGAYTAPKFVVYDAPKKVITTSVKTTVKGVVGVGKGTKAVAKGVGKGAKAVAKSVVHGFGLWGVEELAALEYARRQLRVSARPPGNPFAEHARRQAGGQLAPERKRRGLGGLSGAGPARGRRAGAEFYTRHLK